MSGPVLVVSPVFHEYWKAIEAAFAHLGDDVVVHRYDETAGLAHVRDAVGHRFPRSSVRGWSRRAETDRAVRALRSLRPRVVLVVKGDSLGEAWWDAIAGSRIPVVLWLYDELHNMAYSVDHLRTLAAQGVAVASYSAPDIAVLRRAGVEATHLPDAFDSLLAFAPRTSSAVTFIGARYPVRERLLRTLAAKGIEVEAFGRQWSRHPWDLLRTGRFTAPGVSARRDVSRAEYYGVMAGSFATLNIHGSGHGGLSMRTFEAPGVGALALIDRPDVQEYYDVGSEVLVFEGADGLIEHLQRARTDVAWARRLREAAVRRTAAEHTFVHRMRRVRALWG